VPSLSVEETEQAIAQAHDVLPGFVPPSVPLVDTVRSHATTPALWPSLLSVATVSTVSTVSWGLRAQSGRHSQPKRGRSCCGDGIT